MSIATCKVESKYENEDAWVIEGEYTSHVGTFTAACDIVTETGRPVKVEMHDGVTFSIRIGDIDKPDMCKSLDDQVVSGRTYREAVQKFLNNRHDIQKTLGDEIDRLEDELAEMKEEIKRIIEG
jgi:5,10-methenyltetrahydromethanopterin hydrogenase